MLKKDLERVGIPYETEEGFADFHAAGRHSHITGLLRSGATLTQARELARHGDIRMTMRYTHIGIGDQAAALAGPPAPAKSKQAEPAAPQQRESRPGLSNCVIWWRLRSFGKRRKPLRRQGLSRKVAVWQRQSTVEAAGIEPVFCF